MSASDKTLSGVQGDVELPITEHLKELRSRLVVVLIGLFMLMFLAYPFSEHLVQIIWADFIPQDVPMSVYSPLEWIFVRLKLSLVIATALTVPLFLYEIFRFAAAGLYPSEKRFFIKIVPTSFILLILGGSLAYFVLLPLMFHYLIYFSSGTALPQMSVQETLSSVTTLILGAGLVFQLPLLMVFAVKMGLVKYETLKKQRFIVYAALAGLAMFLSPDPTFISQMAVAVLLVLLFEISLVLAKVF